MEKKQWTHLIDGTPFPRIGYGTYQLTEREAALKAIHDALDTGYRLIDTAENYHNESEVGEAIRTSSVKREEILVSTKLWPHDLGYDRTMKAFEGSLGRLGLDYLDLYLIHWPYTDDLNASSWKAFERLHEQGVIKHIGVSNFNRPMLEKLLQKAHIPPCVNQIEYHPRFFDEECQALCKEKGILIEGWSPLMQGEALKNPILQTLAKKHGRSTAQIALRWSLQRDVIPLPKSANKKRMADNFAIFDFALSDEDMGELEKMHTGRRQGPDPADFPMNRN